MVNYEDDLEELVYDPSPVEALLLEKTATEVL